MPSNQTIQIAPPKLVSKSAASGKILGMMAVAAIFGLIRAEVAAGKATAKTGTAALDKLGLVLGSPFLVLAGATFATLMFVGFADFGGETGETIGVGMAALVMVSSILINGSEVAKLGTNAFTVTPNKTSTANAKATSPNKKG